MIAAARDAGNQGRAHARRLALGTAQLGMPYGVASQRQPSVDESAAILERAWAEGMDTLDTAIAYGDSEARLGLIGVNRWKVVSKLPGLPEDCPDIAGWVERTVAGSLERLGVVRLEALLLHRPLQLLEPDGPQLYQSLRDLREQGLVHQIGISVYRPADLERLWPQFAVDIVQAPVSVVDRRLVTSGWLARLQQAGVTVHVRSIFLQGLLLMPPNAQTERFPHWLPLWARWREWLERTGVSAVAACLGFGLSHTEIDRIIIGIDNVEQLDQCVRAAVERVHLQWPTDLATEDETLINPSLWPSTLPAPASS